MSPLNLKNDLNPLVSGLSPSLLFVGINTQSMTESEMFKEIDIRMEASSAAAISRVNREMRAVLDSVETMMIRMEERISNFTSSISAPTAVQEMTGVKDMLFNLEDFDGDFAGIINGPGEVTPAKVGTSSGAEVGRVTELFL